MCSCVVNQSHVFSLKFYSKFEKYNFERRHYPHLKRRIFEGYIISLKPLVSSFVAQKSLELFFVNLAGKT